MNQIEQVKKQINNRMEINYINVGLKENYISYCRDNGGYFAGLKSTIDELKKWGGNIVQVHTDGNESGQEMAKILKRIDKIANSAGYVNEVKVTKRFQEMDEIRHEWNEISGILVRKVGV